jgi:hypothetical protein
MAANIRIVNESTLYNQVDLEVAIVKDYPIEGGFATAFFLCIFA